MYEIEYEVKARGVIKIDADTREEAKEIFETFQEFELYDDSLEAQAMITKIKKM